MAQFKPAKITSQGQLMMMQDLNNQIDLQFTRIAFGNGEYTEEEYSTITARTALKSQKQTFNINSMGVLSRNSLLLGVVASNATLNEGYSITEVGLFAKDGSDENSVERLYAIVIAEDGCADYMPAYNGSSTVRVRQNFQVDVVDASTVTLAVTDSAVVSQSYLEEFYYNKSQTDSKLNGKMNYSVLDTVSTISGLNEIATNSDYADGKYTLIIPITSGNIVAALDVSIFETAIMTFLGDYVMLHFPYNNKTFRYSTTATDNWQRVYADVDQTSPSGLLRVRRASGYSSVADLSAAYTLYNSLKESYDVIYFETTGTTVQNGAIGKIDCNLGQLTFSSSDSVFEADDTNDTFVLIGSGT